MSTMLTHRRVLYYVAWLVPAMIASFANYTVSVETNPDATLMKYIQIHFFYWMAWGVIAEIIYKATPERLSLAGTKLAVFMGRHLLILLGVIVFYSMYFWLINPSLFENSTTPAAILKSLYLRAGPLTFHVMNAVTYLVVLGACLVIRQSHYARDQEEQRAQLELIRAKLESSLSESRLAALTSQIHPHFLFNAMNNIASLISSGNTADAYRAVTMLAGLLRKTFHYVRQKTISLQEEVELVTTMLKISALRFDDRLSWTIDLPAELTGIQVPPFLIQPLVENALRHGVEATSAPVHITIGIRSIADRLRVTVSDDGPGADSGTNGDGLGLTNLKERLDFLGATDSDFVITCPDGGGFRIEIGLPLEADHAQ